MPAARAQKPPTVPDDVVFESGVEYANPDGQHLQLDIARPKTGTGPFPAVVCIHGGGFRAGKRDGYDGLCIRLAQHGYVAMTVSYRLAPKYQFPAAVHDTKAAVRWARANAAKYKIDPDRIGVTGGSAGGHLVAMLGATSGDKTFDVGENLNVSSEVTCAVDLFGVSDFTLPMPALVTNLRALFGGAPSERPELARSASPVHYVHAGQPPMLVVHGTADKLVPYLQAEVLVEAMEKAGAPFYFHTVVGGRPQPVFRAGLQRPGGGFQCGRGRRWAV